MSIIQLPKYPIQGYEDLSPEEASERLHRKKNTPIAPDIEYPSYRFRPYPCALYRQWTDEARERELMRVSAKYMLDMQKRSDVLTAESLVGQFETRLVGEADYIEHRDSDEVISQIRERNDKAKADLLEQGWAERPDLVKEAAAKLRMKVATLAAERQFEDRRLGEKAAAELEAIDDASEDHVVDVPAARRELRERGALKKDK